MKILQVTATYSPSINGVAITVARMKKELEKNGHEVLILAPDNPNKGKDEIGVIRYPSLPNPVARDYPVPLTPSLKAITKLLDNRKPDIVHAHHPFNVGYLSSLVARHYKVPLVFTYHTRYDAYTESYFKFLPNKIKKSFIQNNVDNFCKKADLIISPSNSITDNLAKRIPYLNITTIPSGLPEIPKENLSKEAIREKLSILKGKRVLLTVCRISKEKNLPLLIKSISQLNDNFFLMIVGGGNYEKQLKDLANREKVGGKVRFIGLVEHDKLGIYYKAADIFVYTSITETQGLIFLEALSFGLPIVAVRSEASTERVPGDVGILTNNTPDDFTNGILSMEKRDKTKISRDAKDLAKQFSIPKVTDKIVNEYKKLIELKRKHFSRR